MSSQVQFPLISVVRGQIEGHMIRIGASTAVVAVSPVESWCVVVDHGGDEQLQPFQTRELAIVEASDVATRFGGTIVYVEPEQPQARETRQ